MLGAYFIPESLNLWFLLMDTMCFWQSNTLGISSVILACECPWFVSLTYLSIGFPILHSNSYCKKLVTTFQDGMLLFGCLFSL